ncbi:methyl-accepting chemotaxis protein [Thalassospira mesophila]|uniref:methyl-accepting chemotaxis protein n=1 Tax=Thalassospira mesophila TaxID=1293891 RepID=UPI000A1EE9F3|nr:methyl-accepting chemotaxis protein [Thalassospira mesophila]
MTTRTRTKGAGIRFKLGASFGAMAALTAIAAIVGIISIERIASSLNEVTQTSSLSSALQAADESSAIAVLASEMATNPQADIQSLSARAINRMETLETATTGTDLAKDAKQLRPHLSSLIAAAQTRQQNENQVEQNIATLRNQHDQFRKQVSQHIDDANASLVDNSNGVIATASKNLDRLISNEVGTLRSTLTLQAEGNRVVGLLIEAANATTPALLSDLQAKFEAASQQLKQLGDESGSPELQKITETLIGFGQGNNNIFTIRQNEITATTQSSAVFRGAREGLETKLHETFGILGQSINDLALPDADKFHLKAMVAEAYALMVAGTASQTADQAKEFKKQFLNFYRDNRKIPETIAPSFKKPIGDFFKLGSTRGGLFDLRKQELDAIERAKTTWSRLADDRKTELFATQAAFRDAILPVVDAADESLRAKTTSIQQQTQSDLGGLLNRDLASLITMARLEATGNLAIGYQNQAAATTDITVLSDLSNRLREIGKTTDQLSGNLKNQADLLSAAQKLGTPATIIDPQHNAIAARDTAGDELENVRKTVETMGVQGVASAAGKQAKAVGEQSTDVIIQGRWALIAIGVISLIFAGLLAWLYVGRGLIARLERMGNAMNEIAHGNTDITIEDKGADEISTMNRTLEVFRTNAADIRAARDREENQRAQATQERKNALNAMADNFETRIKSLASEIGVAAQTMHQSAESLGTHSTLSAKRSDSAARATRETASSVQTVAAAAEQLMASIGEIRRQTTESTAIAKSTSAQAEQSAQSVDQLNQLAIEIGDVITLISDIAEQTNMLALNATIEAARAGDAGKGFAVVANEVKHLANQTAKATADIENRVKAVQNATQATRDEIKSISDTIGALDAITASLSGAIDQQASATSEISQNAQAANSTTRRAADDVGEANRVVLETGEISKDVLGSARDLSERAAHIQREVDAFLRDVRNS